MIGARIGDIVGSDYEFKNTSDYNFPLFAEGSDFTDDTICTVALADAILNNIDYQTAASPMSTNSYPFVGSLAEAQYPIQESMKQKARSYLPAGMIGILNQFEGKR